MKPKAINDTDPPGMLEYIEDVIGTVKYKVSRTKIYYYVLVTVKKL